MLNKGESLERKRFFFYFQKVDSAALWPLLNSTFSGTDTQSGFDEKLRFYKYHNFQRFCYVDATENFWHFHSRFLPILNWVIFLTFLFVTVAVQCYQRPLLNFKKKTGKSAITFGCKYAGAKCGQVGLKNIQFWIILINWNLNFIFLVLCLTLY